MDLNKALEILDQATQPNAQLSRQGYVGVQVALETLAKAVEELNTLRAATTEKEKPVDPPTEKDKKQPTDNSKK